MTFTYSAMAVPIASRSWPIAYVTHFICCRHCRRGLRPHTHWLPCLSIDDNGTPCPGASERTKARVTVA